MFLIINKDNTVSKSEQMTTEMRLRCRTGEITVINTNTMTMLNTIARVVLSGEEWSDIPSYEQPFEPIINLDDYLNRTYRFYQLTYEDDFTEIVYCEVNSGDSRFRTVDGGWIIEENIQLKDIKIIEMTFKDACKIQDAD